MYYCSNRLEHQKTNKAASGRLYGMHMLSLEKGFTIIEVLVAVFILGIAMVGLVMGFSSGLATVAQLREISVADRIVQEKMEELRGGGTVGVIPASEKRESVTYTISVSESQVQLALTKVSVTIQWTSHANRALSRSIVTYFTENGITQVSQ